MEIETISRFEQWEGLAPLWNQLARHDPEADVFQSYPWHAAYLHAHPAIKDALHILLFREQGEVVGLFPLARVPQTDGRMLYRFITTPVSDRQAPVCRGQRGAIWRGVIERLAAEVAQGRALLSLDELSAVDLALAQEALQGRTELRVRTEISSISPFLYLADFKMKRTTRSKLNRMCRQGEVRLDVLGDNEQIQAHLPRFREFFQARWSGREDSACFFTERDRTFMSQSMALLAPAGLTNLGVLSMAGEVIAYYWVFILGERVGFYRSAFAPHHAHLSPGTVLLERLLLQYREWGYRIFDFLRGTYTFKYGYATDETRLWRLVVEG